MRTPGSRCTGRTTRRQDRVHLVFGPCDVLGPPGLCPSRGEHCDQGTRGPIRRPSGLGRDESANLAALQETEDAFLLRWRSSVHVREDLFTAEAPSVEAMLWPILVDHHLAGQVVHAQFQVAIEFGNGHDPRLTRPLLPSYQPTTTSGWSFGNKRDSSLQAAFFRDALFSPKLLIRRRR